MPPPWTDPRWKAEAERWIRDHAEVTGEIEQPHIEPWSTVMRLPSAEGDLWFKAVAAFAAFEPRLTAHLAQVMPDRVPEVVAADFERAWMLMRDGGRRLREVMTSAADAHHWERVLARYAELQIAVTPQVDELLELGVRDQRLAGLPARVERLLENREAAHDRRTRGPDVGAVRGAARATAGGAVARRPARRGRDPGGDPARRSPRRPSLHTERRLRRIRLGRRRRFAPVPHPDRDSPCRRLAARPRAWGTRDHPAPRRVPRTLRATRSARTCRRDRVPHGDAEPRPRMASARRGVAAGRTCGLRRSGAVRSAAVSAGRPDRDLGVALGAPSEKGLSMRLIARLDEARRRRNILEHPFYTRWERGELTR